MKLCVSKLITGVLKVKGNESRYIDKVTRQTKKNTDILSIRMVMAMGAARGIPDYLLMGHKADLWIEYKYVPDLTRIRKIPWSKLSEHQEIWIDRAISLGKNVAIVIGDENGLGLFIDTDIKGRPVNPNIYHNLTPKQICERIEEIICK